MKTSIGIVAFAIAYILIGLLFLMTMPLFSILFILAAVGLFMRRHWGRRIVIVVSILGIVVNTVRIFNSVSAVVRLDFWIAVFLTYLFHLGACYYFTRSKVKEQFK